MGGDTTSNVTGAADAGAKEVKKITVMDDQPSIESQQKITDSIVGMENSVLENGIAEGNDILDISTNTIQPMVNKLLNIEDESKSEMPKSEETNNSEHKEVTELINTELAKNTNIKVEIENNIIENSGENMVNGENNKIKEEEFKEEDFKEEETELVETKTEETESNQSKGKD